MKEQAIKYFKAFRKIFCEDHLKYCPKDSIAYQATLKEKGFYDMAIKAIEQESILDKIRAEINDVAFDWQEIDGEHESFKVVDLNDVLNIIDKYKAEMESK